MKMKKICSFCQTAIEVGDLIGRTDVCPKCDHNLHSCMQCRFYDENAHHQCREPQAEWVSNKEKANFCDYFELGREKVEPKPKNDARSKLEALFKKT